MQAGQGSALSLRRCVAAGHSDPPLVFFLAFLAFWRFVFCFTHRLSAAI